jgi:hypothetical protein
LSIAFPIRDVRINRIQGLTSNGLRVGSMLRTGNILFRAERPGASIMEQESHWASAIDRDGREFIIWRCAMRKRIVAQALDSCYCFEVAPMEEP